MNVAFLGLGAMGARMAARALNAGHTLTVWNRTASRADALLASGEPLSGATRAATPEAAASGAEIIVSMVRDDEASREVWTGDAGALAGLASGAVAIEASTLTPGWARELGDAVAARGAHFLDAPVAGSRPQAEAGALGVLVGGEAGPLATARPVLESWAGGIHHLGPVGAGATMKLAVNALFAIQAAALAETLASLRRAGLATPEAAAFLGTLPIASPAAARLGGLMASGDFAPNFPVALVQKDLAYAAQMASGEAPVTEAARGAFARAEREGFGGDDIAGIAQVYA